MFDNPYIFNAPASGPQFFGRTNIIASVLRIFNNSTQNAVAILGRDRFGKTSILYELTQRFDGHNYLPVYFGLTDVTGLPRNQALWKWTEKIAEKANSLTANLSVSALADTFQSQFLPEIRRQIAPKRLVLLLDDIDALVIEGDRYDSIITFIQKLISDEQETAFILSTSKKFDELTLPFERIGKVVRFEQLQYLSPQETRALITQPVQSTSISYSPEAIEKIADLSGGHPYITQLICHELFDYAAKNSISQIDNSDLEAALPLVSEKSASYFEQLVSNLPNKTYAALLGCAITYKKSTSNNLTSVKETLAEYDLVEYEMPVAEPQLDRALTELGRVDILKADQGTIGNFDFSIPLMADWLLEKFSDQIKEERRGLNKKILVPLGGAVAIAFAAIAGYFVYIDNDNHAENLTPTQESVVLLPETNTPTSTHTASPIPTSTPTFTPSPTETPAVTLTPTFTPETVVLEPTPTETPTPTVTPSPTETPTPTVTPSPTVTTTPTVTPTRSTLPDIPFLYVDLVGAGPSKLIYALAKDDGIYQRNPDGNWLSFSSAPTDIDTVRVLEAGADSDQNIVLYAGYDGGARRWTKADGWSSKFPLPKVHDFITIPESEIVFAATDRGVYRSLDDGTSWEPINQRDAGRLIEVPIYSLALGQDSFGNWTLYAVGGETTAVLKTTVNPNTEASLRNIDPRWTDIIVPSTCGTNRTFFAVATDPTDPTKIYVGNDRSRICFSPNEGNSWTTRIVPVGEAAEVYITQIRVTPGLEEAYAVTGNESSGFASNGILIRDQNPEGQWIARQPPGFESGNDFIQGIAVDPDNPEIIYVAGSKGLSKFNRNTGEWAFSP
jgi:hypothetical protein